MQESSSRLARLQKQTKFQLKDTPFQVICYDLDGDLGAIEDSEETEFMSYKK